MPESSSHQFPAGLNVSKLILSKDDLLFSQGNVVSNIYYIQVGRVKLIRNTIDGSSVILHIGNKGETIAEASMFSNNYHCSAICDVNCEVSYVNKQDLIKLLQNKPKEMMKLLALFSQQIRELRSINEIKNIRSAKERILGYIRNNLNEKSEMKLQVSLKDMAHHSGLAHETFYRELKKLESSGKIHRSTNIIKLKK